MKRLCLGHLLIKAISALPMFLALCGLATAANNVILEFSENNQGSGFSASAKYQIVDRIGIAGVTEKYSVSAAYSISSPLEGESPARNLADPLSWTLLE